MMKKIAAVFLSAVFCLFMTACNAKEVKIDPTYNSQVSSQNFSDVQSQLEKYINGEDFQSQMRNATSTFEAQGLNLQVTARNGSVVYTYQYNGDVDIQSSAGNLNVSLSDESMVSLFNSALTDVKKVVPGTQSIIIEYRGKDGNIIASCEYKDGKCSLLSTGTNN